MTKRIRVGLLGCGVVGGGVVEALTVNHSALLNRLGASIDISRIAVKDLMRPRGSLVHQERVCDDWQAVVTDPEVDVVVEVMGGMEPAHTAIRTALLHGKDVVTANKELMATHGETLQALAKKEGRRLMCEGSVLGGVPAIHALSTYFVANRISQIRGIVNGTNNYILSRMDEAGIGFVDALSEAQSLGFAEADPTMDIAGYDAMFKLRILTRLAFDVEMAAEAPLAGITEVTTEDIAFARQLGCRIRHVAEARFDHQSTTLSAEVGPHFIAASDPLYHICGADNFLEVVGDIVGSIGLSGPGAGALPTASAVVEDIVKVVQGSEFRLRSSTEALASAVERQQFVVRREFGLYGPSLNELSLEWRSALGASQVKYLGQHGENSEAWLIRGCETDREGLLRVVNSSLEGDFAVYPLSGSVSTVRVSDASAESRVLLTNT